MVVKIGRMEKQLELMECAHQVSINGDTELAWSAQFVVNVQDTVYRVLVVFDQTETQGSEYFFYLMKKKL